MKNIIKILYEIQEETGWRDMKAILGDKQNDHISLYMCMEYSRIQKKLKRVWREKQINWTMEAQQG